LDWKSTPRRSLRFPGPSSQANLWASEITGVPFGGEQNLMDILPIIYQFQTNVSLYMSSELTLDQVRNHNLSTLVNSKLRVLDKMIAKLPFCYQYRPTKDCLFLMKMAIRLVHFCALKHLMNKKTNSTWIIRY
jgi:hypothetical protein